MFTFGNNAIETSFTSTASYSLTKNVNGHIIYKTGMKSRMKTIVDFNLENNITIEAVCQLSVTNTYVSCEISKKFIDRDISLRSSLKYGYLGFIFMYGMTKKISEFSNLSGSILIGDKIGVCLNIRYYSLKDNLTDLRYLIILNRVDRASQSFMIPIQLSEEILPSAIFYGSCVPFALYFIVNKFLIQPYVKDKELKYYWF